jgi:hypothetical protein
MSPQARRSLEELFAPGNLALARRLRVLGYDDLPAWVTADATDEPRQVAR